MDEVLAALTTHFGWGAVAMGLVAAWLAKLEFKAFEKRIEKVEERTDKHATRDDLTELKADVKDGFLNLNSRLDRFLERK